MAILLAGVVVSPLVLDHLAPERASGRVGIYDRVTFSESATSGPVLAGLIAPRGWVWLGSRDAGMFESEQGSATITAALRTDVTDPESLVREGLPVGAALLPVEGIEVSTNLQTFAVEYDLAAGDASSVHIAMCAEAEHTQCMLVIANFDDARSQGSAERFKQGRVQARADLEHVLGTVEVVA